MDRFDAMTVFQTVVDMGSLSAASRKLGMPLPTVSRKISELEFHLKAQLLVRSTRKLVLTDTGAAFLTASRRLLDDLHEAERAASGEYTEPRGDLIMTAPVAFGRLHVLPVLCEFMNAYPEVNVRLSLGDRVSNLVEDHVDLALRIGKLPSSGMVAKAVGEVSRIICASPSYIAQRSAPQQPDDLARHQCIGFEVYDAGYGWRFMLDGKETIVPIKPRLVVNSAEAAMDAAIAGAGLASVLSYQAEAALRRGSVSLVLRDFETSPLPVSLLYLGQGRIPLKVRAWLDYSAPRLRERLAFARTPTVT
ncbi:MAG: LysR family transcriptional regulator [Collimonas sp.]